MLTDPGYCQPTALLRCMDKVGPPAGLQGFTAGFSFIQMDMVHPPLGCTVRFSGTQMNKVYPPAGLLNFAGGIYFIQLDQVYPLLSFTTGISVTQMDMVYPPAGLQSLTGGYRVMAPCGCRLLVARPVRTAVPGSARRRPQPEIVLARRVSHRSLSLSRAKRWTTASIATSGA